MAACCKCTSLSTSFASGDVGDFSRLLNILFEPFTKAGAFANVNRAERVDAPNTPGGGVDSSTRRITSPDFSACKQPSRRIAYSSVHR